VLKRIENFSFFEKTLLPEFSLVKIGIIREKLLIAEIEAAIIEEEQNAEFESNESFFPTDVDSAIKFCDPQHESILAYPRFFIQTAEKAKLPTLLFDADFKNFTNLDFSEILVSAIKTVNSNWCSYWASAAQQLQGPAVEKPDEQTKAIVEFIIKILHDLDASDEVDRMKDMVSVISEYLLNPDLTTDASSPIEIFFGAFTDPDSEFDKELVADIISALNVNKIYPRSEFNFQYCAAIIDGYKKQFGSYISAVEGLKNIWKRHFGGENRPYDSFGGQLSNYYALARHLLGHQGSCEVLVKDLFEVATNKIEEVSQPEFLEKLYQRNPEDEILGLIEATMGEIGPIIHTWLKADETLPEETNALTAMFIEMTFMELFMAQIDDVYFYLSKKLKRDPIIGGYLQLVKDLKVDFRKISSRTSGMMKDFGETGVCGEEELENCEEMSRLRRSYPEPVIAGARKSYFNSTMMSMIILIIFK